MFCQDEDLGLDHGLVQSAGDESRCISRPSGVFMILLCQQDWRCEEGVTSVSGACMMAEMLRELVECEGTEEHSKPVKHFYAGVTKICDSTSDQRGPSAAVVEIISRFRCSPSSCWS